MNPKSTSDLNELAIHLGLLALQDYTLTIEPSPELAAYLESRLKQTSRIPSIQALYLDPQQVDLDEHQYSSRVLRYLEDLLEFGSLPDATLTSPEAKELSQIFEGLAGVSAKGPTSDHVTKLLELVAPRQGHLESAEQAKLFMYRLTLLLIKLGVADQELFELLERLPDSYSHQYKSWQSDYEAGQDSGNRPAHAGSGLNGVVDQWLGILNQGNRTYEGCVEALASSPAGTLADYDIVYPPTQFGQPRIRVTGADLVLETQQDLEHHVLGLMLMAGRA